MKKQRAPKSLQHLQLGQPTQYKLDYDPQLLQTIDNLYPNQLSWHSFICTEFTTLCPKTGQPDFAHIIIQYIPHKKLIESKSLKLYLFSFRNTPHFHEDTVETICQDIFDRIAPRYVEVLGHFTPRGGIAIYPFAQRYDPKFKKLAKFRLLHYSPGRYGIRLSRLYGG